MDILVSYSVLSIDFIGLLVRCQWSSVTGALANVFIDLLIDWFDVPLRNHSLTTLPTRLIFSRKPTLTTSENCLLKSDLNWAELSYLRVSWLGISQLMCAVSKWSACMIMMCKTVCVCLYVSENYIVPNNNHCWYVMASSRKCAVW